MHRMKFLHVADLHLGRVFHERPLAEDQRAMLEALLDALAQDDYAALVIAGDVYDRSIPSPDAVSLLGSFLGSLRRRLPDLAVLIISGNHDSADRLAYADRLFAELGIHIVTEAEESAKPIILEKGGEKCAFFLLPFLTPGALRAEGGTEGELPIFADAAAEPLRSQRDLAAEAALRLERARKTALAAGAEAAVLVAHLFASGGSESESERVFLGTAERVDIARFAAFDYVALGHLHRPQRIAANAWYAGSPLAYSFDEADQEKAFLAVGVGRDRAGSGTADAAADTARADMAAVKRILIKPPRRLRRLSGAFDSFLEPGAFADCREDYLEIALEDMRLTENPLVLLRDRFPYLLSVKQDSALAAARAAEGSLSPLPGPGSGGRRGAIEDFQAFLTDLYGTANEAEVELFRTIAQEADDETA